MADAAEKNELLPFTDYPLNLPDDVALGVDRVRYQERLCKHIRSIAAKRTVKFDLFESEADGQLPSQHTIEDQQSARQAISEPRSEGFDCRILFAALPSCLTCANAAQFVYPEGFTEAVLDHSPSAMGALGFEQDTPGLPGRLVRSPY